MARSEMMRQDTWYSRWTGDDLLKWGVRLLSFAAFLIFWQWYGSRPDSFAVAPPTRVFPMLWEVISSGEILDAALGTVSTMLVGYCIAVVLGITIGALIALSTWGRNTIEPLVNALYSAPMSLLIPIIGIYIGLGFRGRVFLVVVWAIFVIIVNTAAGFRETPHALVEMARSFRINRWDMFRKIILPAALPYVLVGLRLGIGRAIRGAVTAEILLGVTNLGKFLIGAGSTFNMPKLLAGIVFVVILGLFLLQTAETIERRILDWRHY